jgi:hypothetical protein
VPPGHAGVKSCVINNYQKNSTNVFIEFELPQDESYGYVLNLIRLDIVDWATRYNIPYTQKTIKYTHRLGFNKEKYFSLFSLTWDYFEFKIIDVGIDRGTDIRFRIAVV